MINIQDIIPFMKDGWVAMAKDGVWNWWERKPGMKHDSYWWVQTGYECCLSDCFDIAPADDWTKSLICIKGKNNEYGVIVSVSKNIPLKCYITPKGYKMASLCKNGKSIIMDYYTEFSDFMKHPYLTEQVLAPVPSYDEWQALIDLYKEADVIIKKSDKENAQLKTDCHILAKKLLQVKPELREWLEVNFKEYL